MNTREKDHEKNFDDWINARCVASPVVSAAAATLFSDWLEYYHLTTPDPRTGKRAFNKILVSRGYLLVYSSGITVKGLALKGTEVKKAQTWKTKQTPHG